MDFRERDVAVRGLSLRVRERGPQDGPASVLLHGWLDHRGSFDLLAPLLPGRTVAVDQRGHGDSSWAGAGAFYHFVEYLGDLDGLLRELELPGPVRLVGHSMGGAVSLLPAAARLLAGGAVGPDPARGGALAWKWDPLLRARSPLPYTKEVLQEIVGRVRAPVLLLRAERGHLPDEQQLRSWLSAVPSLTVETLPGTSHHLHIEQPELVADRVRRAWDAAARDAPPAGRL